jgi:hypothetical protein
LESKNALILDLSMRLAEFQSESFGAERHREVVTPTRLDIAKAANA